MIVFRTTGVKVKILRRINRNAFVIQYGEGSITSCFTKDLFFLN